MEPFLLRRRSLVFWDAAAFLKVRKMSATRNKVKQGFWLAGNAKKNLCEEVVKE